MESTRTSRSCSSGGQKKRDCSEPRVCSIRLSVRPVAFCYVFYRRDRQSIQLWIVALTGNSEVMIPRQVLSEGRKRMVNLRM